MVIFAKCAVVVRSVFLMFYGIAIMNLHEFQAKELLKRYEVPVPEGIVVTNVAEAEAAYETLKARFGSPFVVLKAQIHAGGRGKGLIRGTQQHGVEVAKSKEDVQRIAGAVLGGTLVTQQTGAEGKVVRQLLMVQDVYYKGATDPKEYYLSILLDRATAQNVIVYSTEGGVDIEAVAEQSPHKIFREFIAPNTDLEPYQARKIAFNLGLSGEAYKQMTSFITKLYKAYVGLDCAMLEINPLFKTADDKILTVDCKMSIEDNALLRHPEFEALRDLSEEDPAEVEAKKYGLTFIKLDGNVGCMVNGAGLAMATMDMVQLNGGAPANFLDAGGTAKAQTVEAGFRIILKDPKVKAVLINIFGGIVRCDQVAMGVIEACKSIGTIQTPIIVRLQGTNAEKAKQLIDASGLQVQSAILMSEAAALVQKAIS